MTVKSSTSSQVDGIVQEIQKKGQADARPLADFSHITSEIEAYHAHHPQSFHRELNRINTAFHSNAALDKAFPDLQIVGANGQDLVFRDSRGNVLTVDSHNINRRSEDAVKSWQIDLGGRVGSATMMPDGSGQYIVPKGGKFEGWNVAAGILKKQSGDANFSPTDNQIANYLQETKKNNPGVDFDRPKPGQVIDLPPTVRQGSDTSFEGLRWRDANDLGDRAASLKSNYEFAKSRVDQLKDFDKALKDYRRIKGEGSEDYPTKGELKSLLQSGSIADPGVKKSLEFLQQNWDSLSDLTRDGRMDSSSVLNGRQSRERSLENAQASLALIKGESLLSDASWHERKIVGHYAARRAIQRQTEGQTREGLDAYLRNKPAGSPPDRMSSQDIDRVLQENTSISAEDRAKLLWVQQYMGKELIDLTEGRQGQVITRDSLTRGMDAVYSILGKLEDAELLADAAKPRTPFTPKKR
jgi:hypothetical protein